MIQLEALGSLEEGTELVPLPWSQETQPKTDEDGFLELYGALHI